MANDRLSGDLLEWLRTRQRARTVDTPTANSKPSRIVDAAWGHPTATGSIENAFLLSSDWLNVKRSLRRLCSAVAALRRGGGFDLHDPALAHRVGRLSAPGRR